MARANRLRSGLQARAVEMREQVAQAVQYQGGLGLVERHLVRRRYRPGEQRGTVQVFLGQALVHLDPGAAKIAVQPAVNVNTVRHRLFRADLEQQAQHGLVLALVETDPVEAQLDVQLGRAEAFVGAGAGRLQWRDACGRAEVLDDIAPHPLGGLVGADHHVFPPYRPAPDIQQRVVVVLENLVGLVELVGIVRPLARALHILVEEGTVQLVLAAQVHHHLQLMPAEPVADVRQHVFQALGLAKKQFGAEDDLVDPLLVLFDFPLQVPPGLTAGALAVPQVRHGVALVGLDQVADQRVMRIAVAQQPGVEHAPGQQRLIVGGQHALQGGGGGLGGADVKVDSGHALSGTVFPLTPCRRCRASGATTGAA